MTNFERLEPLLAQVIAGDRLSEAMTRDLVAFRREPAYHDLPPTPQAAVNRGDEALFLLRCAADALTHLANGDPAAALAVARKALHLPRAPDPLGGAVYRLGEHLADQAGDGEAHRQFGARYRDYLARFSDVHALGGLGDVFLEPYVASVLGAALENTSGDETGREKPLSNPGEQPITLPYLPPVPPLSTYLPFASASFETPLRTYLVRVQKLTDARVAAFAISRATLADITDGGDLGREDERGRLYADLVLDFEGDGLELLRSLESDDFAMRLVFRQSETFEAFSVADATLFDVEVSLEEGRLYFKLRVPPAWIAAQLPLHLIWPNVESCVLLSAAT